MIIQQYVIGTLAVDGWTVILHVVQWGRAWVGCSPAHPSPRCNSPVYQLHIIRRGTL